MRRRSGLILLTMTLLFPAQSALAADPGRSTPSFNESDGCQDPAGFHGPRATRTGALPDSEPLYGPLADTFGRSMDSIRNQLAWWTVPMSGGKRVRVHSLALPAFQQVTQNLQAAADAGLWYQIRQFETAAFVSRTIGGRRSISLHAFGIAIDINTSTNPYRSDNRLISDMPTWFVDAWRNAGFCWGGNWREVKDAMHYSWKGPAYTPNYPHDLIEQPPTSIISDWQRQIPTDLAWKQGHEARFDLRDGNRDGAVDVYRLRPWGSGTLIELSRSSKDYAICGVWREWAPAQFSDPMLMADFDNTARLDLWTFDTSGTTVSARVWLHREDFEVSVDQSTSVPVTPGMQFEAGDFDDDGLIDLVVGRPGNPTTLEIWSGASGFTSLIGSSSLSIETSDQTLHVSVTDFDRDDLPDLALANATGNQSEIIVTTAASGFGATASNPKVTTDSAVVALEFGDFDGDGRDDIISLDTTGTVVAHLGGQLPGSVYLREWFRDPAWTCPSDEDIDLPDELDSHLPRISGSDRYATAAAVSAKYFPDGAETAIIASGLNFPDALVAAPVAASLGGPVLLTHPAVLPSATATEIRRLGVTRVVIAGGNGAVSETVAAAIAGLPLVTSVERVAGPDRYGTAAALASLVPNPSAVYIATGENYPDALAAAPAAAQDGAPLLLVASSGVPEVTRAALQQIGPAQIFILGGPGAVPEAVADQLRAFGDVDRLAGPTRYSTAVAIASRLPNSGRVMVVSGEDFADAVAAGATAAALGIPLILIQQTQVPPESGSYLATLRPASIIIVGGPATVTRFNRAVLIEYVYTD